MVLLFVIVIVFAFVFGGVRCFCLILFIPVFVLVIVIVFIFVFVVMVSGTLSSLVCVCKSQTLLYSQQKNPLAMAAESLAGAFTWKNNQVAPRMLGFKVNTSSGP